MHIKLNDLKHNTKIEISTMKKLNQGAISMYESVPIEITIQ